MAIAKQLPMFRRSTYDYSRGRRNESAQIANPSDESKSNRRAKILEFIASRPVKGTTLLDIHQQFGWLPNTFSGRISELKEEQKIQSVGRRDGHSVYVVKEQV